MKGKVVRCWQMTIQKTYSIYIATGQDKTFSLAVSIIGLTLIFSVFGEMFPTQEERTSWPDTEKSCYGGHDWACLWRNIHTRHHVCP